MAGCVRTGAAGILTLLVATSGALAAAPPGSSREERRVYAVTDLLDQTSAKVERDRACRPRPTQSGPTDATPSAEMLQTLAPLRRPQQSDELNALGLFAPGLVPSAYQDYVRIAHAADGTAFTIIPSPNVHLFRSRPRHCVSELRRSFRSAIAGKSRAFRTEARRQLRQEVRFSWIAPPREGVVLFVDNGGAPADLVSLRRRGAFTFRAGFDVADATFYGLLPDGVASIDFTFRRAEPTGYWSKHHPITLRWTAPVHDNVVAFHVPLTLPNAWMSRQVWRAADGSVIRVAPGG
jgi:hypothetical protein